MARVLIDGRFIGIGDSVSRYTLEIAHGILSLDKINQYTLLVRPQGKKEVERYFGKEKEGGWPTNLKCKIFDIPHYSIKEQTQLLRYLNNEKFDLVHFTQFNHPIFYRGKFIITIHDLTLFGHLHRQNFAKRFSFSRAMISATKNSRKVITVSETSKKDIIDNYKISSDKIVVTYEAVDKKRYNKEIKNQLQKINDFKEKYHICGNYLLYTGMWKRHKNIMRMFAAFERYAGSQDIENLNTQLVLVGKVDPKEPEVMTEINRLNDSYKYKKACKQLFVSTGFVLEDELPIAYAGATAYIIPSLSEGFGLPPLEAMACGTPVISSSESCMPEILGKAAMYFDPYNIDDISRAIKKILEDANLRQELIEKGFRQIEKYDWGKTAKETLDVYSDVLRN